MQISDTKTVREIALEMPFTTRVFEEFKIDYCCGGRRTLAEACAAAGADAPTVSRRIEEAIANAANDFDTDSAERKTPSELIDYILEKHHAFGWREMQRLPPLMEKVAGRHGADHPELLELQTAFQALCEDLNSHFRKEENVLFPFIKTLEASLERGLSVAAPHFRTVKNPVRVMIEEHDAAGDFLRRMREIAADYKLPEGACPSYTALYAGFEDLERDLHRHIHLENNVLFPQAIVLEEKVVGSLSSDAEFDCRQASA